MEATQVLQTGALRGTTALGGGSVPPQSQFASASGVGGGAGLLGGIRHELEAVETPERNYECTVAFCGLLRVLLSHGPAVVPLHTLGASTRAPGLPAGVGQHVRFVLDAVLIPARSRPVAHDADRLRVAAAALGVLYDCVRNYSVASPPPPLPRRGGSAVPPTSGASKPDDAWVAGDPRWDFLDPALLLSGGAVAGAEAFSSSGTPPPRSHCFDVMRALLSSSHGGERDDLLSVVLSVLGPPPGEAAFGSASARARGAVAGFHVGGLALTAATSGGAGSVHAWEGAGASSGGASALETEAAAQCDSASSAAVAKRTLIVTHARERIDALQRAATAGAPAPVAGAAASAPSPTAWMSLTSHEEAAALVFAGGGPELAASLLVSDSSGMVRHSPQALERPPPWLQLTQEQSRDTEADTEDAAVPVCEAIAAGQQGGRYASSSADEVRWRERCALLVCAILEAVLTRDAAFISACRSSLAASPILGAESLTPMAELLRRHRVIPIIAQVSLGRRRSSAATSLLAAPPRPLRILVHSLRRTAGMLASAWRRPGCSSASRAAGATAAVAGLCRPKCSSASSPRAAPPWLATS